MYQKSIRFTTNCLIGLSILATSHVASARETSMRSINHEGVNVRQGAGLQHDVLWRVIKHFPYKVTKSLGDWREVKDFEGDKGWVHSRYLSKTPTVIIKNKFANLRSAPDLNAKKIKTAQYGEVFVLSSVQPAWVEIKLPQNQKAWVYRQLIWGIE